jgi:uncharacterized phage-associated protein
MSAVVQGAVQAPSSAAAVGNYFLRRGWQEPNVPPIDQMKLQNLLFYAHAWHLAYRQGPLFAEDIEAWPWGPVIRPVYLQTKHFGAAPVSSALTDLRYDYHSPTHLREVVPEVTDAGLQEFLKGVWETHKFYTGIQLSNSTHAPGEPWTIIKDHYGSLEGKPLIPNDLISDIYAAKLRGLAPAA